MKKTRVKRKPSRRNKRIRLNYALQLRRGTVAALGISFHDRAVAFIDVLGFKDLVRKATSGDRTAVKKLNAVCSILSTHVRELDYAMDCAVPRRAKPLFLHISDSLVLSVPLTCHSSAGKAYEGLGNLVVRCIQIQQRLLCEGMLCSGAVSVGKVCHQRNNIVGEAYQEAYEVQSRLKSPAIVLAQSAIDHIERMREAGGAFEFDSMTTEREVEVERHRRGSCIGDIVTRGVARKTIVNQFHIFYWPDDGSVLNGGLSVARKAISDGKGNLPPGDRRRAKWDWAEEFLATQW